MRITPVLLCGGSGTRLWPLSRKSYPKQFSRLVGDESLFQASARRLSGARAGLAFDAPMVLTNADFRFIVTEQLTEAGIDPGPILIEPAGRNTGPAVLAAALWLLRSDPDAIMLVAPSDHVVPDTDAFCAAVANGLPAVAAGDLVTFGIAPTRAETGYGYLEQAAAPDGSGQPVPLRRFVEKPDAAAAAEMLATDWQIDTEVWSATSFSELARQAREVQRDTTLTAPVSGHVVERNYTVEERMTIDTVITDRDGAEVWRSFAINEVSIEKLARERMIEVLVRVDGRALSRWGTDGVLLATPTGSTAYAFSANGPVLWPDIDALLVVPLSAHALFSRPMVIGPHSTVSVEILPGNETQAVVWCDGRRTTDISGGMVVTAEVGEHRLRLARITERPFVERLVRKFALPVDGWRGIAERNNPC